jgi:hypothetical protein
LGGLALGMPQAGEAGCVVNSVEVCIRRRQMTPSPREVRINLRDSLRPLLPFFILPGNTRQVPL